MNEISYLHAILLGIVQGLTEFLPISSSGHLALAQMLFGLDPDSQFMIAFDVAVHLGTVVAIAIVFFAPFVRLLRGLLTEFSGSFSGERHSWRIVGLGVAASIPTAIIGVVFKDDLEAAFAKPVWIGIALLVTGTLLWITGKLPRPRRGWRRFGVLRAIIVGIGQGLAIMPGISRSGTTIAVALMLGIRRKWAGQFSFFIAVPAICGAAVLKAKDIMEHSADAMTQVLTGPLLAGTLAATITGYFALRILLTAVQRARLHYFSYYCWLIGVVTIFLAYS